MNSGCKATLNSVGETMKKLALIIGILGLGGCAEITLTIPYSPTTTQEIGGSVGVGDFTYFPKDNVQQNEIRETAAGRILLTEPVGLYFANAVRREFRQAGISLKGKNCKLDGEINDFAMDSLGYSTDYITDVRYILRDGNERVLIDNNYQVKFNTSKFVVAQVIFSNLNKAVSDNISQLLSDPFFAQTVTKSCKI